ncbi:MAG: aminotransferase class V-fold PLP-dependent enzyme [Candidatus Hodgkinia cicadicola]
MHNTVWLRSLFGILTSYSSPLVYLDNASTTQKPDFVLDAFKFINFKVCANLARGKYFLSYKLGLMYALARKQMLRSVGAGECYGCVVYKSATEALNRVCLGLAPRLGRGVVVGITEHHSGLVPWLAARRVYGIGVEAIGLGCDHILNVNRFLKVISANNVGVVLISHMSNVLGALIPIRLYVRASDCVSAVSVIDGTQAASHLKLNLSRYACTEYVLTAHKLYGPAGVGIGIGTLTLLQNLPPVVVGGGGIRAVNLSRLTYALADSPLKHEAGSPMSFGLISLSLLIAWRYKLGFSHELCLLRYTWMRLANTKGVYLLNKCLPSTRMVSFEFELMQADDVCAFLNKLLVCIRAGAHCAMPLLLYLGRRSVCRASLALYNTFKDVDVMLFGLSYLSVLY